MKEINYIMTTMTENSLIIIDELCRSTSLEEGTALAIAIVEKLAESSAFIYITTHFTLLTKLYEMYLNVKVWQMETIPSGEDPKTFKLDFKYNLVPGVTSVKRYGVYIVRNIWPDRILKYVDNLLDKITKKPSNPKFEPLDEKLRLKYTVESKFRKLKYQDKLTLSELNKLLNQYQDDLQKMGYPINIRPLSDVNVFTTNMAENFPQICHSVFGSNQNFLEDDLHSMDERIKENFTPSTVSQLESQDYKSAGLEFQQIEQRMSQIFTPESSQQNQISNAYALQEQNIGIYQNNSINEHYQFSDNSSYKNLSQFIAENSENINMLIPELDIRSRCDDMSDISESSSKYAENGFGLLGSHVLRSPSVSENFLQPNVLPNKSNKNLCENKDIPSNHFHNSSIELSKDMDDFRFSLPLCNDLSKTSTPNIRKNSSKTPSTIVHIYENRGNFSTSSSSHQPNNSFSIIQKSKLEQSCANNSFYSVQKSELDQQSHLDIDLESIQEDLEEFSKILENEEDDFEEKFMAASYTSNSVKPNIQNEKSEEKIEEVSQYHRRNQYQHYLSPVVRVVEGLNNTTLSIDEKNESVDNIDKGKEEEKPKNKINIISDIIINRNINQENSDKNKYINNNLEDTLKIEFNCSGDSQPKCQDDNIDDVTVEIIDIRENFDNENQITDNCPETYEEFDNNENDLAYKSLEYHSSKTFEEINSQNNEKHCFQSQESRESFKSIQECGDDFNDKNIVEEFNTTFNRGTKSLYDQTKTHPINTQSFQIDNINTPYKGFENIKETTHGESYKCTNPKEFLKNEDNTFKNKIEEVIVETELCNTIVTETTIKLMTSEEKTHSSTNINKTSMTSISAASKVRNLEEVSSDSTTDKELLQANNEDKTANISSTSKKKNLDQVSSDSSRHAEADHIKTSPQDHEENITSLSSASKKRYLDQITSNSSSQNHPYCSLNSNQEKSAQAESEGDTTTVSSASKKRNLDEVTTDSSPSDGSKMKMSCTIENTSQKSNSSSVKESDGSGPKRKRNYKKGFSIPRPTKKASTNLDSSQTSDNLKSQSPKKSVALKRKFVPPRKLSAKEIREEFRQQDQKILEASTNSSNFSKYLGQLINRPSVKQIQNTTHLVYIRKTNEGVEVIPAAPSKKRKISPVKRHFSNENFNMSIFSDKNAAPFENYLNSNEKDYKTFSFNFKDQNKDTKSNFQFIPTNQNIGEYTNNSVTNHFVRTNSDVFKSQSEVNCSQTTSLFRQISENSIVTELVGISQKSFPEGLTPDGFYKQNKEDITNIMNKYLQKHISQEIRRDTKINIDKKKNIFENDEDFDDLNI